MNSVPFSFDEVHSEQRRRRQRPDWVLGVIAVCAGLLSLVGAQIVLSGMSEGYCIVWPSIGTAFAADYSERGFDRIKPGMTQVEVLQLIGQPLGKGFNSRPSPSGWDQWRRGDETWTYSQDSSARGGDWAWLSREVVFRQGVVVQTVRWIYYD